MVIFDIEDIVTEKQALEIARRLKAEAIKASCAQRGKSKKIRLTQAKIEMLMKWAVDQGWADSVVKSLKGSFEMLEEASSELSVNLWGI